tara:strand:- start:1141 stop:1725 length:585 start_codon:yes stop_codon:yes gene_type:complete
MINYNEYINNLKESLDDVEKRKDVIENISETLIKCFDNNNKLLVCGNGGSCSDAAHFVGELTCTFKSKNKKGLPAIDIGSSMTALTAWGNDFNFESFFERQVMALGKEKDILFLISTGGGNIKENTSMNLVRAANIAKKIGMKVISLIGKSGGELKKISDISFVVKSNETSHVQETHIVLLHMICEILDERYAK